MEEIHNATNHAEITRSERNLSRRDPKAPVIIMMTDRMDSVVPPPMPLMIPDRVLSPNAPSNRMDVMAPPPMSITRQDLLLSPNAPIIMSMADRTDLMAPPLTPLKIPARRRESYRCDRMDCAAPPLMPLKIPARWTESYRC
jgi:hypothetical protein